MDVNPWAVCACAHVCVILITELRRIFSLYRGFRATLNPFGIPATCLQNNQCGPRGPSPDPSPPFSALTITSTKDPETIIGVHLLKARNLPS